MTTNYHTPIAVGAAANAATFNSPLGELDSAITTGAGLATTGATTGATAQAQPFTVGITLADTTTATSGVIFKAADRFVHNFHHPTGNTAVPLGLNTFVGVNAGNFTIGSTATSTAHGSKNVGVGYQALTALTTGYDNIGIGAYAQLACTTGYSNIGIGRSALLTNVAGYNNIAIGADTLIVNTTGYQNVVVGNAAMGANTEGEGNTAIGQQALASNTTGIGNVAVGVLALYDNATGTGNVAVGGHCGENALGSSNTFLGWQAGETTTGAGNVFLGFKSGYYETGSNKLFIDNAQRASEADARTKALLYGVFDAQVANQSLTVNGALNVVGALTLTSGVNIQWGDNYDSILANNTYHWMGFNLNNSERIRITGDGTVMIGTTTDGTTTGGSIVITKDLAHRGDYVGFYNVSPIVRAVLATGAGATVDNVITALQNLGLVKQS